MSDTAEMKNKPAETCPSCGYCPHCGHRPAHLAPYWYPQSPYWQIPWYIPTYPTIPTWTTTTLTLGDCGNVTSGGTNAAL
jgi:hypothetical protein